jgi:hypothetical protein
LNAEIYTLREKQSLFARLLAQLILWIFAQGWEVTLSEGYVGITDGKDFDHDGPHMRAGAHYTQLGQDLNLFVQGKYQRTGCPEWDEIGAKWLSYHPLCRWGGQFKSRDWNHVSLFHEGRQ